MGSCEELGNFLVTLECDTEQPYESSGAHAPLSVKSECSRAEKDRNRAKVHQWKNFVRKRFLTLLEKDKTLTASQRKKLGEIKLMRLKNPPTDTPTSDLSALADAIALWKPAPVDSSSASSSAEDACDCNAATGKCCPMGPCWKVPVMS